MRNQIILDAQAHGTGSEQELLVPVAQAVKPQMSNQTVVTADAGYHSEDGLKVLAAEGIDTYIPDNGYRKRDERYHGQVAHKAKLDPLWDKRSQPSISKRFGPGDFQLAENGSHCFCPAGKRLYSNGSNCTFNGHAAMKFRGGASEIACFAPSELSVCAHRRKPRRGRLHFSKANVTAMKPILTG